MRRIWAKPTHSSRIDVIIGTGHDYQGPDSTHVSSGLTSTLSLKRIPSALTTTLYYLFFTTLLVAFVVPAHLTFFLRFFHTLLLLRHERAPASGPSPIFSPNPYPSKWLLNLRYFTPAVHTDQRVFAHENRVLRLYGRNPYRASINNFFYPPQKTLKK